MLAAKSIASAYSIIFANYQIYGDKVYSNSSQALYADYVANVPEDEWPVYFAKMIEYALAMDLSLIHISEPTRPY